MKFFYRGRRLATCIIIVSMLGMVVVSNAVEAGTTVSVQQLFEAGSTSFSAAVDHATVLARQSALTDALDDAKDTEVRGMDEEYVDRAITKFVAPMVAQQDLDAAKMDEAANARQRAANVSLALDRVLLETKRLTTLEKKLAFAKEKLAIAKARHDAGTLSDIDFADAGYALKDAEYAVEAQKLTVSSEELSLKLTAEVDLSLVPDYGALTAPVRLETIFEGDVSAATLLTLAEAADSGIQTGKVAVAAAEMRLKYATQFFKAGDVVYDDYALALETARRESSDAERSLSSEVSNALSDWSIAGARLKLAIEYSGLMQKQLDTANNRFKAGVAARTEVIDAEAALLDARMSEHEAVSTANKAEIALRMLVGETVNAPGASNATTTSSAVTVTATK